MSVQIAAVERTGSVIRHISSPSEAVQLAAVKQIPWAVRHIDNPSEVVLEYALNREPRIAAFLAADLRRKRGSHREIIADPSASQRDSDEILKAMVESVRPGS